MLLLLELEVTDPVKAVKISPERKQRWLVAQASHSLSHTHKQTFLAA